MRTLVIGASGFLGGAILDRLKRGSSEVWGTSCSFPIEGLLPLDLKNKSETRALFEWLRPELVFQPAFNANVELCEEQPGATRDINVRGTEKLIEIIKERPARYVFFSSDYVFDGTAGPYTEDDVPRPINEYGKQKLECEEIIQTELDNFVIVRTTVVYGRELRMKNFVAKLLASLLQGREMRVPTDQRGNPTCVDNLADASVELARRHDVGVFNIVGTTLMDRHSFARLAADIFGMPGDLIVPTTTSELRQKAARPLHAGLSTTKAEQVLKTHLVGASEGLTRMKEECEKAGDEWARGGVPKEETLHAGTPA